MLIAVSDYALCGIVTSRLVTSRTLFPLRPREWPNMIASIVAGVGRGEDLRVGLRGALREAFNVQRAVLEGVEHHPAARAGCSRQRR